MGNCVSTGDPHITTFDHMKFDLYDLGKYTMVKSRDNTLNVPDFEIQIVTSPYGKVSQTESAEIQIPSRDGSRDLTLTINRDGTASITADGEKSDLVEQSTNDFTFKKIGGFQKLTVWNGVTISHSDEWHFVFRVPIIYQENVEGLCGDYNQVYFSQAPKLYFII